MPSDIQALFEAGILQAISTLWATTLRALVVWGLAGLLIAPALYGAFLPLLHRLMRRRARPVEAAA